MMTFLGDRQLAAIVFSDVVSFSERMGRDERRTLAQVSGDLGRMGEVCRAHNGRVIKSTGDGLLMYFQSAADAVGAALDIQREFAERSKSDPEALTHRIGVHLGDVFIRDDDVMGDGVNIAARLQHEAEPGGICISQTVFDVIRGKVSAEAVAIGPRELKNIRQSVHAYQLVIDAARPHVMSAAPASAPPSMRRKRWLALAISAIVVMGAALTTWKLRNGQAPEAGSAEPAPGTLSDVDPAFHALLQKLGRTARVFIGSQGERATVVTHGIPGDREAFVMLSGVESQWDGLIVLHRHEQDDTAVNLIRTWNGEDYVTLWGRDVGLPSERWWMNFPEMTRLMELAYSADESKAFDRETFARECLRQHPVGGPSGNQLGF